MLNNILVRLAIYYLSWLGFLAGAFHFFPRMRYYVTQERDRFFIGTLSDAGADVSEVFEDIQQGLGQFAGQDGVNLLIDPSHTVPVVVALTLAFGVTLPITWVYRWTRQKKKYSQSFAHTLLVIPIAIALVVFLVKGSVALAFSLAGIVAAVRFRASLNEPTDAVFMLMAIGIGLAAGTQLTTVAYLASLMFVVITLAVWKSNFGAKPAVLSGWRIVHPDAMEQASEAGGKANAK
jgi:hypothetical protein